MRQTYPDSLQVARAHDRPLEVLDVREMALEESVELEVGRSVFEEDALDVAVFAVLVQKIAEEVVHRLVRDVAADDDVSEARNIKETQVTYMFMYFTTTAINFNRTSNV